MVYSDIVSLLLTLTLSEGIAVVAGLVKGAFDDDELVRNHVQKAIQDIGVKQQDLVISTCMYFIETSKIPVGHRLNLLEDINITVDRKREKLAPELSRSLVQFAGAEMCGNKEFVCQERGSLILVSLSVQFPEDVLNELLRRFEPGHVPNIWIMKSLGEIAQANPAAFVPRVSEVFARMLPTLGSIKVDPLRLAYAEAIGSFCEAINSVVGGSAEQDAQAREMGIMSLEAASQELLPAYEMMFSSWLTRPDEKLKHTVIVSLGQVTMCLARPQYETQLPKLIPAVLAMYKKSSNPLAITQGLSLILTAAVRVKSAQFEPLQKTIMEELIRFVCILPDPTIAGATKNYNELLRCF